MDALSKSRFARPVERTVVARDWAARGYDCHEMTDRPGQEWNDFTHRSDEVLTVASGCLECIVGTQRVRVQEGDELFIPRHATHSVRNVHHAPTRWLFGYN